MRKLLPFLIILFTAFITYGQSVPSKISYQGILFEDDFPFTGQKTFTFTIGDWTETHIDVEILDGRYQVQLGSINPITAEVFNGQASVTLKISVDGEDLSPNVDLLTVPYAFLAEKALNADSLGGISAEDLVSRLGQAENINKLGFVENPSVRPIVSVPGTNSFDVLVTESDDLGVDKIRLYTRLNSISRLAEVVYTYVSVSGETAPSDTANITLLNLTDDTAGEFELLAELTNETQVYTTNTSLLSSLQTQKIPNQIGGFSGLLTNGASSIITSGALNVLHYQGPFNMRVFVFDEDEVIVAYQDLPSFSPTILSSPHGNSLIAITQIGKATLDFSERYAGYGYMISNDQGVTYKSFVSKPTTSPPSNFTIDLRVFASSSDQKDMFLTSLPDPILPFENQTRKSSVIKSDLLSDNREYQLPDESGVIAITDRLVGEATIETSITTTGEEKTIVLKHSLGRVPKLIFVKNASGGVIGNLGGIGSFIRVFHTFLSGTSSSSVNAFLESIDENQMIIRLKASNVSGVINIKNSFILL